MFRPYIVFVLLKVQSLQLSFRPAGVSLGGGGGGGKAPFGPPPPLGTPLGRAYIGLVGYVIPCHEKRSASCSGGSYIVVDPMQLGLYVGLRVAMQAYISWGFLLVSFIKNRPKLGVQLATSIDLHCTRFWSYRPKTHPIFNSVSRAQNFTIRPTLYQSNR